MRKRKADLQALIVQERKGKEDTVSGGRMCKRVLWLPCLRMDRIVWAALYTMGVYPGQLLKWLHRGVS